MYVNNKEYYQFATCITLELAVSTTASPLH